MNILFIHCAYQCKSAEDTVVKEEIALLQDVGAEVASLLFDNQNSKLKNLLQMPFNFEAYKKTKKKIRTFAPDVVHVHTMHYSASPSVIYAAKKRGIPVIITLDNFRLLCPSGIQFHNGHAFLHSLRQKFPWTAIKEGVYRNSKLLTAWLAISMQVHRWIRTWRLPDQYIVLNRHAQRLFLESNLGLSKEQIVVKPNCLSLPGFIPSARSNSFFFAGRLCEAKGVSLLLRVFADSTHSIVFAGDGP